MKLVKRIGVAAVLIAVLAAALLFSFSDFVLMLMTFSKGSLFGNVINLITYYAAQLLFAGSVLLCR